MGSVKMNGWLIEDNWLRGSFDASSNDAGSWFLKEITKLKYIQVKVPLNHKIDKIPLRLVCPSLRFRILYIMAGTSWRKSRWHSAWRHQNSWWQRCCDAWWTDEVQHDNNWTLTSSFGAPCVWSMVMVSLHYPLCEIHALFQWMCGIPS